MLLAKQLILKMNLRKLIIKIICHCILYNDKCLNIKTAQTLNNYNLGPHKQEIIEFVQNIVWIKITDFT